jgi:hypothetical protein
MRRNTFGYDATGAHGRVVTDGHAWEDDHVRTDPDVISNRNWRRWRRYLTPFDTVVVEQKCVMTQQAVVADFYIFAR